MYQYVRARDEVFARGLLVIDGTYLYLWEAMGYVSIYGIMRVLALRFVLTLML